MNTKSPVAYADVNQGSVQYDPLQAHEIGRDESKGVMVNPL